MTFLRRYFERRRRAEWERRFRKAMTEKNIDAMWRLLLPAPWLRLVGVPVPPRAVRLRWPWLARLRDLLSGRRGPRAVARGRR